MAFFSCVGQSAIEMVFVQSRLSDLAWLAVAPSAFFSKYQQPNGSATKKQFAINKMHTTYWICNFVNINSSFICDVEEHIVGHYRFFTSLFISAKAKFP
jgi:hypothetical protein